MEYALAKPPYRPIAFTSPVLASLFAVVIIALATAVAGRINPTSSMPTGNVAAMRELLFEDGADGSVIVRQPGHVQPLQVLTGEQGFLRGAMRGMARTRKAEGFGPDLPFRLIAWADGRFTLEDPATNRKLDLSAFGPMNTNVFGQLLTAEAKP